MAFIMLATLLVPIALMKTRLPPRRSGPIVDVGALKERAFAMFLLCECLLPRSFSSNIENADCGLTLAVLFTFIGLYVPFFYVETYALSIGVRGDLAFYTLIIMSAASVPGRILPPFIAAKFVNRSCLIRFH